MSRGGVVMVVLVAVWLAESLTMVTAADITGPIRNSAICPNIPVPNNVTRAGVIVQSVHLWQGVVLLLCLGAFALFVGLIHRLIRTYIYYDAHLLDTFFDGGGDLNMALIAAACVTRWMWTSTFSQPVNDFRKFGLVGHFWYSAALSIHLFLFSILAAEIRIKAPGAKTFLQVIRARFGAPAHVIVMVFALICNVMVIAMVMLESTRVMVAVTEGLSKEVAAIVIAIAVGFYTVVGGVGGAIYVAYFACALAFSIMLVFFTDVFYNPMHRLDNRFGSVHKLYDLIRCGSAPLGSENEQNSILTFLSRGGMLQGILLILAGFSSVFVNQSFWQAGVAAKPGHAVWGFITGGLTWFALPFALSLTFGSTYWFISIQQGGHVIDEARALAGMVPVYMSQTLMGNTGTFLILVLVMLAVLTTASAEILSISSIIIYDIYQTYISPFRASPVPEDKQMSVRMQRAIHNEEYLEYDRRSVWLKHVVVICVSLLLIPIALVVLAANIDVYWLFMLTGIVCGGCVMPIAFAITWHRTTAGGVISGVLGGFSAAIVSWLVVASIRPGGLMEFRINTGHWLPLVVGLSSALGVGGLMCIIVSLSCGGCDGDLVEEEEWEKTRQIDNPILPWSVKYAPDIGANNLAKGRPHFYTVRRSFKASEICAYIFGVLLAVCLVLVWPASMLTADIFTKKTFRDWSVVVLVWACVASSFIIIVPLLWEMIQTCRQAYYNRLWARSDSHGRLEEDMSEMGNADPIKRPVPPPSGAHDANSESDLASTIVHEAAPKNDRWKTFIHLD